VPQAYSPLPCYIYRSDRKADTYLYLAKKDDFSDVPEDLLKIFGEPQFSFEFLIKPDRKLVKENSTIVYLNLKEQGYHLQLQNDLLVEQMLKLKASH